MSRSFDRRQVLAGMSAAALTAASGAVMAAGSRTPSSRIWRRTRASSSAARLRRQAGNPTRMAPGAIGMLYRGENRGRLLIRP